MSMNASTGIFTATMGDKFDNLPLIRFLQRGHDESDRLQNCLGVGREGHWRNLSYSSRFSVSGLCLRMSFQLASFV